MRILLLGATGLIGSAIAARLVRQGDAVVGVSRGRGGASLTRIEHRSLDIASATSPEQWMPLLGGVDAVINCAGLLQDGPGDSVRGVHVEGLAALWKACEQAGIRRVVHLSAIGVDRETPTEFSRTKQEADRHLMASGLDWVILRPSVVIGRAAYGGSALMRGLAALPVLPVFPDSGQLQLVHLDDVVDAACYFARPDAPAREVVELVGPRRWEFSEAVQLLRRWMRWPHAKELRIPGALAAIGYRLGDLAGLLGWRPPVRTTARREVVRGAWGDPARWIELTGAQPRDLEEALRAEPASVQDRWFARLYLLKAPAFAIFGLFWITTGIISLGPGWDIGMEPLRRGGMPEWLAVASIVSGALADIVIGCAILYRRTTRLGLLAALGLSVTYAIVGTVVAPWLWADPLGPMLKIFPIMVLNLMLLAILEDR